MYNPRATLRQLLRNGETIVAPGIYDPLTARLAEKTGFNAVYCGGWTTGAHLCTTEPLMTMTEQLETAQRIAKNVDLPVMVDGHTGYGDAVHAARTVKEFEFAGIAGIHIEDQLFPKRVHYHKASQLKHIIPVDEAIGKLRAAMDARTDPDFLVIARTDAWGAANGGIDETVRRMEAYANAGAEALLPLVFDPEHAARVRRAVPEVPMMWLGGLGNFGVRELSITEVRELGYQIIVYPLAPVLAASLAVQKLLEGIREKGVCELEGFVTARRLVEDAIRLNQLLEIEAQTTEKQ